MLGVLVQKGGTILLDDDTIYSREARAHAVVVKVAECSGGDGSPGNGGGRRALRLRIPLDDGSCFDVSRTATQAEIGDWISVGDVVPVRFDLDDHSKVEVDLPFLQEHLDESTYTPLGSWHPIERLRRLTDLHDHGLLNDEEFDEARVDPMPEA
jgi:hypothetical protein